MRDFWRLPDRLTPAEEAGLDAHSDAHDHYASMPDQPRWLQDACFRDVDCAWRNRMWACWRRGGSPRARAVRRRVPTDSAIRLNPLVLGAACSIEKP